MSNHTAIAPLREAADRISVVKRASRKTQLLAVAIAALAAFIASSFWYSPVLFGNRFLALSGAPVSSPNPAKFAAELVRNLLLVTVIAWLFDRRSPCNLRSALAFVAVAWIGFPVILLSGSVMWQNVHAELALIHCGDWLIKILLATLVPWSFQRGTRDSA